MGGMDIADRLRPQDGRARVAVNGNPVDLRISTLPASLGEKVVIRILNTRATVLALDSLGFDREELRHKLEAAGFEAVRFQTAVEVTREDGRTYSVFFVTARVRVGPMPLS